MKPSVGFPLEILFMQFTTHLTGLYPIGFLFLLNYMYDTFFRHLGSLEIMINQELGTCFIKATTGGGKTPLSILIVDPMWWP